MNYAHQSSSCPGDWTSNNGCCGRCAVARADHWTPRIDTIDKAELCLESLAKLEGALRHARNSLEIALTELKDGASAGEVPLPIALADVLTLATPLVRRWGRLEAAIQVDYYAGPQRPVGLPI